MTELTYTQAKIAFPGSLSKESLPNGPFVAFNWLRFMRNDCLIQAVVFPYCLPTGMVNDENVQRDIIRPGIKLVSEDIETIDDLLQPLQELANLNKIQDDLLYQVEHKGNKKLFKVYDYSCTPFRPLFERILRFKGKECDVDLFDQAYAKFPSIAENVSQEEGHIPHTEGATLREAVERAIEIYSMANQLSNIRP